MTGSASNGGGRSDLSGSGPTGTIPDLAILDSVAHPVFVLIPDAEGHPIYAFWNRMSEHYGGRSRADVIGRTARQVFSGAFGEAAFARHCEALKAKTAISYDLMLDLGGVPSEVHTKLTPVLSEQGEVRAVVGTSTVVSGLRAAEQREVETLALVERARSEMEQYLTFAAHDLRAPMNRLAAIASLLRDELQDGQTEAHELTDLLEQVSSKAQELISDVLDFNLASNAGTQVETFDLALLCRDIFTVLDPMQQHDLGAEEARITADRLAIQIVLRNLVDNAIKHSDKERIWLRITLAAEDGGMELRVSDDGPGLPAGDLEFLDGKGVTYGQGFGLLGIRRMIMMRRGTLTARPREGGGTTFHIRLPGLALAF
ncbi:sensor histidine kinase [Antarctobacter jejuensis]|uniref:sensor histidine kinase n=1 Tax=Antarctobacter jejuensis TaxID=1439938 RepID=UPI003FD21B94